MRYFGETSQGSNLFVALDEINGAFKSNVVGMNHDTISMTTIDLARPDLVQEICMSPQFLLEIAAAYTRAFGMTEGSWTPPEVRWNSELPNPSFTPVPEPMPTKAAQSPVIPGSLMDAYRQGQEVQAQPEQPFPVTSDNVFGVIITAVPPNMVSTDAIKYIAAFAPCSIGEAEGSYNYILGGGKDFVLANGLTERQAITKLSVIKGHGFDGYIFDDPNKEVPVKTAGV